MRYDVPSETSPGPLIVTRSSSEGDIERLEMFVLALEATLSSERSDCAYSSFDSPAVSGTRPVGSAEV